MKTEFDFIDLFAGIGGFRLGFEPIGGRCVFTSEINRPARITYAANHHIDHPFVDDIRPYSNHPERIPKHDVLLAGFPCQSFSTIGKRGGFSSSKANPGQGELFFEIAKILEYHRPAAFLLENVPALTFVDGGKPFKTIISILRDELKYDVQWKIIDSKHWTPQVRKRIFIVGFREMTGFNFESLHLPPPVHFIGDILESGPVDSKLTIGEKQWNDNCRRVMDWMNVKEDNNIWYLKVRTPQQRSLTIIASYWGDRNSTVVRQDNGKRPRYFTPLEVSRLMGFNSFQGDSFKMPVSFNQSYHQYGNSVVVPVIRAIAELMRPHLMNIVSADGLGIRHVPKTELLGQTIPLEI